MIDPNPLRNVATVDYQGFDPADRIPELFELPQPTVRERLSLFFQVTTFDAVPSILIVDLSHWNGNIDWVALWNSGVRVIILKCSESAEGTYYQYKDTKFEENWRAALDHGFVVMIYHFFRGEKGSAEKSWLMKCADAFLNDPRINGKTAVWLDCEWKSSVQTTSSYANRAFNFCDLIKGEGMRQGIYSSPGLVPQLFHPNYDHRWDTVFQWNAHWTSWAEDTLPRGWSESLRKVWQFGIYPRHDWAPVVKGCGEVDVNHGYWASVESCKNWLGLEALPTPSPSPPPPPADCCEEHALRLDTIEAGMRVLTEIQQAQQKLIDAHGASINTLIQNTQSLGERVDQIHNNQTAMSVTLQNHDREIATLREWIKINQEQFKRIHRAFHPDE